MTYSQKEKQEKRGRKKGRDDVPPYNEVPDYISPCLCALGKAPYILFSLPQHKHCSTTESHQSSLYLWLGQTYSSTRRNIVNHDELNQLVLGPGHGPPSSWGRGGSGDQAHPPRRRDQPDDFGPASLPASRCGNDSLKMWKWCRRNDAKTAEEMMQKQGEEKKNANKVTGNKPS